MVKSSSVLSLGKNMIVSIIILLLILFYLYLFFTFMLKYYNRKEGFSMKTTQCNNKKYADHDANADNSDSDEEY